MQFRVEDTHKVTGIGLMISGKLEQGDIRRGSRVQWHTPTGVVRTGFVKQIEGFTGISGFRPEAISIGDTAAEDFTKGTLIWNA